MTNKEQLIQDILKHELEMFLNVNSKGHAACQENPDGFRFYRGAMFASWSKEALRSYLQDVKKAQTDGNNLVTLKYARMEKQIPELNNNPLIDKILDIEMDWLKEFARVYPHIRSKGRPIDTDTPQAVSAKTYLRCELETYSDQTLELYYQNLLIHLAQGNNLATAMHTRMINGAGYESLQEAEQKLAGG